jgi:hypothetical protein
MIEKKMTPETKRYIDQQIAKLKKELLKVIRDKK